ncbi:MAG TPA: hypothetical protein VEW03_16260, partial [Longimicrobiaceae bacterium]|nr:hypothetical protein [Longimicrobiaceae bacterium]
MVRPPGAPGSHKVLTYGAVFCGALSLLMIGSDLSADAFVTGLLIAVVPVPAYVVLALWLDRFEPEPARTLAQTFAWGATVAVFISLLLNTVTSTAALATLGPELGAF